jgi:hypothetical protein
MKIQRLETHDRLLHFIKDQSNTISQGCEDCLKKNPLSLALQDHSPYIYIFAHPRTAEDGITKRMLWQPRLTKPQAQTNSYLFRAKSKSDIVDICWMIPPPELWDQYIKGNVTESDIVRYSITMFKENKAKLEEKESDDLLEYQVQSIYASLGYGGMGVRPKILGDS